MAVPVISRQIWNLCVISWRYVGAENRWHRGRKCEAMGPYAERKRCTCPGHFHPCICRSRWRVGWCESSARLLS